MLSPTLPPPCKTCGAPSTTALPFDDFVAEHIGTMRGYWHLCAACATLLRDGRYGTLTLSMKVYLEAQYAELTGQHGTLDLPGMSDIYFLIRALRSYVGVRLN